MINRLASLSPLAWLAALGLILYASRTLAEIGAGVVWPLGAILGGLAGLGIGVLLADAILRHGPPLPSGGEGMRSAWPLLILWADVLYPAYDPRAALGVGLVALLAWLVGRPVGAAPAARTYRAVDGAVFAAALILYWRTLSPGLLPADAGEFQLVAARLGIAHPPGYPLYTLIGWLFTWLMPGNPLRAVSLFSAVTAALAVMLAGRAARRFGGGVWGGIAASLALMVAASVWSTATQASIRPLTAFFTALCVERLATYRSLTWQPTLPSSLAERRRPLAGFTLALGLGLTHHPSLAFPGIFFLAYLLLIDPALIRQPRRWPLPLGAFALGLLPWLYLPIRGAIGGAPFAPEGIATWGGFWDHVLARGFAGDLFSFHTPAELADRARVWINILALQWNPVIGGAAALAAIRLARRDGRTLILLGGAFLLHSFVSMTYRAPQTVEYLIPAYVALTILLGVGLTSPPGPRLASDAKLRLGREESRGKGGETKLWTLLPAIGIVASLAHLAAQWPSFAWLARDDSTRATAEAILDAAPPDAVVLASWHWATPLLALQRIEGQRPDVEVIYVYPEGSEPLAQTWVRRIEAKIGQRPVVITSFYPAEFAATPYFFESLPVGWLVRTAPRRDLPSNMAPVELPPLTGAALDGSVASLTLIGVDLPDEAHVGETFEVRLAWRVDALPGEDVHSYVHFNNASGVVISVSERLLPTGRARVGDVLVERYTVGMPPYGLPSPLDTYQVWAGVYSTATGPAPGMRVLYAADHDVRFPTYEVSAGVVAVDPAEWPSPTAHPLNVRFANGARITGFDWEGSTLYLHAALPDGSFRTVSAAAEGAQAAIVAQIGGGTPRLGPWGIPLPGSLRLALPRPGERYVPLGGQMIVSRVVVTPSGPLTSGQPVTVDLTLLGARPLLTDNVAKVDLIGEGYAWRSQSDHIPATGALPTLKWLWGWRVEDRHRLAIPPDASTAAAHAELVVYDHFTGEVLPLLDPVLAQQGIVVPLYQWGP